MPIAALEQVFDRVERGGQAVVDRCLLFHGHRQAAIDRALVFKHGLLDFEHLGERFPGLFGQVPAIGMALLALLQLEGGKAQRQHAHLVRQIVEAPAQHVVLERFHGAS
jgi:hypothetical protein